ncbi:PAR16-like protein, partial [Mya arenaria]
MMATMDLGAQGVDEEVTELAEHIKERIWQDPLAADLQWSLFLAALCNYRYDTRKMVSEVPALSRLSRECHKLPNKQLELIKWVLDARTFVLNNVGSSKFSDIKKLTGHLFKVPKPNFIFEVQPSAVADERFEQIRDGRGLMYAYHGSRLENFFSILHNGLALHMNKMSVFGEGTYLSSELSVSLIYSPQGGGWDHSELGNSLSCVAVCEMIDAPSVKCQDKPYTTEKGSSVVAARARANAGPSEGGDVPEKYYVVQNNEVMRVKYLLVYGQKTASHKCLDTSIC